MAKKKVVEKSKVSDKGISKKKADEAKKKLILDNIKEIKWTPKISVHEKNIDEQHKKIIEQIKVLESKIIKEEALPAIRECIHFLDQYIKKHFTYEEAYMEKYGYPDLEKHKELHASFIAFYEDFKKDMRVKWNKVDDPKEFTIEYAKKVHKFLWQWVLKHTMKVDLKYAKYIDKKKGLTPGKVEEKVEKKSKKGVKPKIDLEKIKKEIHSEQIKDQREPVENLDTQIDDKKKKKLDKNFVNTGITGFDELMETGIPKGNTILVAGGAGSGKTIFCLQTLSHHATKGKKCLYMSFEEAEGKLENHMEDFGWKPKQLMKKGRLKIQRMNPFDITRNVDALLAKQKGELLIDVDPVIIPKNFKPDFVIVDSLTAIASAFTGKEENYRIYIEQLFRFFEKMNATALLITETEQIPKIFSKTGVEEFLADGVVVMYNLKHGNVRENAIEILKLRGAKHEKKIVAMQITGGGIVVYPEQEVFSEINTE